MDQLPIIFIVGPTAVGKSDVGVVLAESIGGEIVSCDAMQVYREISIASNKPTPRMLTRVPHHLIGIVPVEEEFDVGTFNELAVAAIDAIQGCDRVPIVVGGSGMYMQVLLDGIFEGGARNASVRKDLKEQARQFGNDYLYAKLKEEDPAAAKKIHPNDLRRVIRALEVCATQHAPISELQKKREGLWGKREVVLFGLTRERRGLYRHINERVDHMLQDGLVEEIRALEGVAWSMTAKKIIGVQEIQGFLRGERGLEEAKEMIKLNTRRFAKRQLTWFRREKRLQWIMVEEGDAPDEVARVILEELREQAAKGGL